MIMYRKPENHLGGYRSGHSHYEPLYSNGKKQSVSQIHRLSQGADYYGSDNSDRYVFFCVVIFTTILFCICFIN